MIANIKDILKKYWDHDSFRELQEEIIQSVLNGKDSLALLPTGGGKSICFQIPVLAQDGIGIVISPLIALMKDQVENLSKKGIKAIAIYSGMTKKEIDVALDNCIYGNIKFLYVSPERTLTTIFRERLKKMNVSLVAIDESHCISQWGHDFRPSYLKIIEIKDFLHKPTPFLALTATANKRVVKDIITHLNFKENNIFKQSFERKNLGYLVLPEENKNERLIKILSKTKSSSIVYVGTRKKTVAIAHLLKQQNFSVDYYHGGLTQKQRTQKQDSWKNNKTQIIVATNAFGMGIDKPDVRVVVHIDIPSSPEAYFQEAGRAGRDGKKSYATLLYKPSDKINLVKLHNFEFPDKKVIKTVYKCLGNYFQLAIGSGLNTSYSFDIGSFGKQYNIKPVEVYNAIKILELNNFISLSDAIYHPTTLKILLTSNDLYNFQIKNKKYDSLLRGVLRLYADVFNTYKKIDVTALAKKIGSNYQSVNLLLKKLKKLNVIDYIEAHDSPILTYTTERLHDDRLTLSKETYLERKKTKKDQLDFMIKYCESQHICRNRLLLSYFDEVDFKNCGICDVCIQNKKSPLNNTDFEIIINSIKANLSKKELNIKSLVNLLPHPEQDSVKVIQWMMDNNQIEVDGDVNLSLIKK